MYCACTPTLMSVAILVSEILLLSKTAKFPFPSMVIKKFNHLESAQKIHTNRGQWYCACTPILMGVAILVSEILLISKTAKFPFLTIIFPWSDHYSPWSFKKFNYLESTQKNHANRGQCIVHAHQL